MGYRSIPEITQDSQPSEATPEHQEAQGGVFESKVESEHLPQNQGIQQNQNNQSLARELLVKARNAIQFRKRKKLDKILDLFAKRTNITNDEVEKYLHVSDATATRYLSILEKEGKIVQTGKTGKSVSYSRI